MSPGRAVLVLALVAVTVAGVALSAALGDEVSIVLPVVYGILGAYVVARRPTRPIGWLLITTGWGVVLGTMRVDATADVLLAGDLDPLLAFTTWANSCGWSLAFVALTGLTVVFPDERLPGGGWGVASTVALVTSIAAAVVIAVGPVIVPITDDGTTSVTIPNPYALAPDAAIWQLIPNVNDVYPVLLVTLAVAGIGLIVRSQRATGVARLQFRWFIASVALVILVVATWAIAVLGFSAEAGGPTRVLAVLGFAGVPVAITVAVMRYRLFEIDRIISRTISWALVTGVLASVFVAGVFALQTLLTNVTQGETLAVAASTLLAFALFQPVRQRVQRAVDRRFYRARYDAEQTTAALATRLRGDLDLGTVRSETLQTVITSVRPTRADVWIREGRP